MDQHTPEKVRFHIVRKSAFSGALLPCWLCINGEKVGTLLNGRSLDVEVPKAELYFIDEICPNLSCNAIIRASDLKDPGQISMEIRREGGWKTDSYYTFFTVQNGAYVRLPSLDSTRYVGACFDDRLFSELTEPERIVARCNAFYNAMCDGADQVLCDEHLFEMLDALQAIGATQYGQAFASIVSRLFQGVPLPLDDDMMDHREIMYKLDKADTLVWEIEKKNGALKEFHKCLVTYIIEHLDNIAAINFQG